MSGSTNGSSTSHGSRSCTRSVEVERVHELNASGRTRRACPSASKLRRWGQAPFCVGTSIDDQNVSLLASASDACVRRSSFPTTTSMPLIIRGDAVRRPRASILRDPASEEQRYDRRLTCSSTLQRESLEPTAHTVDDSLMGANNDVSTGGLSCDAVAHEQYSASASPILQMPVATPSEISTVPVEAGVRTYHVNESEAVWRGDGESTRTCPREPWMPSSSFQCPEAAVPLQPIASPPPTSFPVGSHSSVSSSSELAVLQPHPREDSSVASRKPVSSLSSPLLSRLRERAQATPLRDHSGDQAAVAVPDTNDPSSKVLGASCTPSAPTTPVPTAAEQHSNRRTWEDEPRMAASTADGVVGERGDGLLTSKPKAFSAPELQDCVNGARLVTSTVADVSAVSPTTRDERRRRLADAQPSHASTFSFSLPPSSTVSSSWGIARILQLQAHEGWRDALRAALQQDVEVWVRQVYKEQRLLQAQLSVTQSRAAALAKDLQGLHERGLSSASTLLHQSPPADSTDVATSRAAEQSCSDETSGQPRLSHLTDLKLDRPATSEGDGGGSNMRSASEGEAAPTLGSSYTHELEAYVRLLEQHTHALHSEKYELQLRLDQRTSKLALSQQRYLQHYARVLQEKSVLERDYWQATEDVEQLVGMLVVARAAERAAMRRVGELELALEESELRAEALAAALHSQAKENGVCDIKRGAGSVIHITDPISLRADDNECLRCQSGYTSALPPSSAFVSFTEHNETDRSLMSMDALAAASGRTSVGRPCALAWRSMSASSSMYPPLSPDASSLTAESIECTPVRGQATTVGREFGGEAEPPWGRTAYSLSSVPLSATPSPMRTAADVERNSAACSCSPEACAAERLTLCAAGTSSQSQGTSSHAGATLPRPTSLLIADAIASAGATTVASRRLASSQRLDGEGRCDSVSAFTALTTEPASARCASVRRTSVGTSTSVISDNTSVYPPVVSTTTTMRTPRTLARQRCHVLDQIRELCGGEAEGGDCSTTDEHQLLQFRCTLLELELQAKETTHKAEKEAWEAAVHQAEGVVGVMGEVEARVREAAAASEKARHLLHDMSRLWSKFLALEEDEASDDSREAAASAARLVVMDEERKFLLPRSRDGSPLY
ncbi:hypothetical protein, conserved [Leishmania tarentolae]|uniref:Uncharacterized protein n=1 Tax=Leishmania tarentolae TaxID=5689 RepID=A0A640KHC4_LEITA|nr:hypothetical protein, conserved [Leishmania tarentolae]